MLHRETKKEIEISRKCGQGKGSEKRCLSRDLNSVREQGWTSWENTSKRGDEIEQGPVGLLDMEAFLIRGRRGCRDKGGAIRKQ